MELAFFIKGLLLGFIICVPFGPIGLLCVRRTLMDGKVAGVAAVLGASVVDAIYCAVAGFGVTYILNFLTNERTILRLAGGLILIAMGIKIFLSPPTPKTPEATGHGFAASFGSSFFLMLTNPLAVLVFTATFSALGIGGWEHAFVSTGMLVIGVFVGSSLWGPIFVAGVHLFSPQLTPDQLRLANRIAGVILFGFGMVACFLALLG